ncbi:MAG TPA: c-type cytochrome [Gemmatimonadaceae bacterium]
MLVTTAIVVAAACQRNSQEVRGAGAGGVSMPGQDAVVGVADTAGLPAEGVLSRVAIGDIAGVGNNTFNTTIRSPYAGDEAAIREGGAQFEKMNCAACHGYDLKGGMGPNLTDTYWRFGGSPADIYKSIFEGRSGGMPAWGRTLTPPEIWKLVAYIESQGGAFSAKLADRARQGDVGDHDTTSGSTMKGRNSAP